jgi:hypothetical protein
MVRLLVPIPTIASADILQSVPANEPVRLIVALASIGTQQVPNVVFQRQCS